VALAAAAVLIGLRLLGAVVDGGVLVNGAVLGLGYALLGTGIVLVYKATRVVNFAHGYVGALGAVVNAKLVTDVGLPFPVALVASLLLGAAVGALVEVAVVRRLFRAPRLTLLVATIAVAQLLLLAQILLPDISGSTAFPTAFDRQADLLGVVVTAPSLLLVAVAPAVVVGLALLLSRTPLGTSIRATAENVDAARLAGIDVRRISTTVWAMAGALAVLTAVLVSPVRGDQTDLAQGIGPALLLRALAAAMVGRLESLPLTFAGGLVVGIGEQIAFATFPTSTGLADVLLLALLLGLLLLRSGDVLGARGVEPSLSVPVAPVPAALRDRWWVRRGALLAGVPAVALLATVPLATDASSTLFRAALPMVYVCLALSVTVLTGWAGQLSLGQWAVAGVGAFTVGSLTSRGMPLLPAIGYAVVAGVLVSLVLAAPALRIRGVLLAVVTLAFAVSAQTWLLPQDGLFTGRVVLGSFADPRAYYLLVLVLTVAAAAGVARLRRTGVGRRLVALRENERSTSAVTVSPAGATLLAFALSGAWPRSAARCGPACSCASSRSPASPSTSPCGWCPSRSSVGWARSSAPSSDRSSSSGCRW
jgi:branched-subunit amino acid ABC-type transport system permease component